MEHVSERSRPEELVRGGQAGISRAIRHVAPILERADIRLDGRRPWDIRLHNPRTIDEVLGRGTLGLGESYMWGWWDCEALDEFFVRALRARLDRTVASAGMLWHMARSRIINLQSRSRAREVGERHYDIGNDLFAAMLDRRMIYSCGYWADAEDLDAAQEAKLDLICRKLGLGPGMRLLDIGCGWGGLVRFAAEKYGARCVGLTISREQAEHARQQCAGLPVEIGLEDYREYGAENAERFDRIASVGMFEHVGHHNYGAFFEMARRCLADGGAMLLHTIGSNRRGSCTDPWLNRYIFPNGELPALAEIEEAARARFIIEDVHNFGPDYDRTLMAWRERFEAAWPRFADRYGERFARMWRYYLMSCAATFRARQAQLWQIVLRPCGAPGAYRRPT